jgi:hypothetical protein
VSEKVKSAEEIAGFEYDWLAVDADGHVAQFSTAGAGYAPSEFLRNTDAHEQAIDLIRELPISTTACFAVEVKPQCENSWKIAAERGLFAFDSHPNGGPYRLAGAPAAALHVSELPAAIATVANSLVLGHLRFSALSVISEEMIKQSHFE